MYRAFDEFLKDPNISLKAKGFLTMVLTNNITTGFEVENYCSDSKEDIKDALLELRIAKYIRYNSETNTLEANAVPYDKWNEEKYLHKDKNQFFSIAKDNALEIANPVIVAFVKYAIREKKFDFVISEIINKANLMCTPTQLGKLLNTQKDLLEQEGLHISKYRTTEGRMYHIDYEEPSLENE